MQHAVLLLAPAPRVLSSFLTPPGGLTPRIMRCGQERETETVDSISGEPSASPLTSRALMVVSNTIMFAFSSAPSLEN